MALVSKRVHGLLYSAHLLQHVAVQHYAFGEEHLISLCCWLAAHCAGRMQRLRLRLKFVEEDWEELTVMQLSGMLAAWRPSVPRLWATSCRGIAGQKNGHPLSGTPSRLTA